MLQTPPSETRSCEIVGFELDVDVDVLPEESQEALSCHRPLLAPLCVHQLGHSAAGGSPAYLHQSA